MTDRKPATPITTALDLAKTAVQLQTVGKYASAVEVRHAIDAEVGRLVALAESLQPSLFFGSGPASTVGACPAGHSWKPAACSVVAGRCGLGPNGELQFLAGGGSPRCARCGTYASELRVTDRRPRCRICGEATSYTALPCIACGERSRRGRG